MGDWGALELSKSLPVLVNLPSQLKTISPIYSASMLFEMLPWLRLVWMVCWVVMVTDLLVVSTLFAGLLLLKMVSACTIICAAVHCGPDCGPDFVLTMLNRQHS